jgi:hypothetical protein
MNAETQSLQSEERAQRCCATTKDCGVRSESGRVATAEGTENTEKEWAGLAKARPLQRVGQTFSRGMLEVAFLGFVEQILGGTPGQGHDG